MAGETAVMSEEERALRAEIAAEVFGEDEGTVGAEGGERLDAYASPEMEEEKTTVVPEVTPQVEDPMAGMNPALKAALDRISERMDSLSTLDERLKQAERRVGSVTNQLHEFKEVVEKRQPTKEELDAAMASEKGWNDFKEDFPTHAVAIEGYIQSRLAQTDKTGESKEMIRGFEEAVNQKVDKIQKGLELKLLKSFHPNHLQLIKEPEFRPWLEAQPKEVQAKYSSWDALDGIDLLNRYTAFKGGKGQTIAQERENRLSTSATPQLPKSQTPRQKLESEMTDDEYRRHIARQIWRPEK